MPTRATIGFIVLLWLSAVGWQAYRAANARYTAAPRLLDSLRLAAAEGESAWVITHNGVVLGRSVNEVREDRIIGYILRQNVTLDGDLSGLLNLKLLSSFLPVDLSKGLAFELNTDINVTQFGSLSRFSMNAAVHLDKKQKDGMVKAYISGRAEDAHLLLSGYFTFMDQKFSLPSDLKVRYDSKTLFLSSLAPADCLPGLTGGQQWEAPVIDLKDLMGNQALGAAGVGEFSLPSRKATPVRVREEPVWWGWHGENTACWLVESKQPGLVVQLWVRQSDGFVLRQQARFGEAAIDLIREPRRARRNAHPPAPKDDAKE